MRALDDISKTLDDLALRSRIEIRVPCLRLRKHEFRRCQGLKHAYEDVSMAPDYRCVAVKLEALMDLPGDYDPLGNITYAASPTQAAVIRPMATQPARAQVW